MKIHAARMPLPAIMATGTWPRKEFAEYPWLQPAAALLKPYAIAELLATVEKILCAADSTPASFQRFNMRDGKIPQAVEPATAPARNQTNPPRSILVVDDNGDTRQLSVDVLTGSGYDVEWAKDGAAGWEALQANNYNLVVTDNQMPRMTGIEMIEKLRASTMAVPVIMATRYLPADEFARRPWLKPDAMLERPFSNDELLETVTKILGTDGGHKEVLLPG
jgi:CheY-like chemotaxis protein